MIKRTVTLMVLCVSFVVFSFISCVAKEPDMVLTTWCGPPFSNPDQSGYLDQILTEAFERMHLKINIIRKPAERSVHDANRGITDGEFVRVTKIGQIYPNLLIVPEHLYDMEFVAFAKRDDVKINGWESLKPFKVGIVIGWKILEENVKYTNGPRSDVPKPESLFKILDLGRIDIAVYSKHFGFEVIEQLGLKGIRNADTPLAKEKMYLFLHKKHEHIIPAIDNILKCMKKDGFFSKMREKTLLK